MELYRDRGGGRPARGTVRCILRTEEGTNMVRHLGIVALAGLVAVVVPARAAERRAQRAARPYLGVAVDQVEPESGRQGLVVREVDADSPAGKAGVRPGDVIIRVGDRDVKDLDTLFNVLAAHK